MINDVTKWARGDALLARKLHAMVKEITAARTWRVAGNARFIQTPTGQALWVDGSGSSITTSFAHLSTSGSVVTIGKGYVLHGNNAPVQVPETTVEITGGTDASPHYVVLEYNYDSRVVLIHSTGFSALPQSEPPNIYRCALHAFKKNGTTVTHVLAHKTSDIDVPGWG